MARSILWGGVIVLSGSVLVSAAAYSGGSGTEADPYKITAVADWNTLIAASTDWNRQFILLNDIDFAGANLTPVAPDTDPTPYSGYQGTSFSGVLNGDGHSLLNAVIHLPDHDHVGLFGGIGESGQIRNLGIQNIAVTGRTYVGGLCGRNQQGVISDCFVTGTITGGNQSSYVGGLCGWGFGGTISGCYTATTITGGDDSDYMGGFCGSNSCSLSNSIATGTVTGGKQSNYIGGLCGENNSSTIRGCYATGKVAGGEDSSYLGGLCGLNNVGSAIMDCYASGGVSGAGNIGGLVGENANSVILHCYSTGKPTGTSKVGGLCGSVITDFGYEDTGNVWDKQTSKTTASAMGTGKTTSQMKTQSTYTAAGWDFTGETTNGTLDIWKMGGYPKFTRQNRYSGGIGILLNPYQISAVADWKTLMATPADWNLSFILTADIDLAGTILTPVGNDTANFTGHFSGNGHTIRNAAINLPGSNCVGLFGYLGAGGRVQDLGVEKIKVVGNDLVGGLTGVNGALIRNCLVTGEVTGKGGLGGLCGQNSGTIMNCSAKTTVTAGDGLLFFGGLVGMNNYAMIDSCYATGTVTAGNSSGYLGGLCGSNDGGVIRFSYATGQVTGGEGTNYLGGLCGLSYQHSVISGCYATGAVNGASAIGGLVGQNDNSSVILCYSTGKLTGNAAVGGLCGMVTNKGGFYEDIGNFWDIQTSQTIAGEMGTGKTTAQMKTQSTFTDAGWDFTSTWWMPIGGYPRFGQSLVIEVHPGDVAKTCTVTAGKTLGIGTLTLGGTLGATAQDFDGATEVKAQITADLLSVPLEFTWPVDAQTFKKGIFNSARAIGTAQTMFKLDTRTKKFSLSLKNANLQGLRCPFGVEIVIGGYSAPFVLDETLVNRRNPCPEFLLMGALNRLTVDKCQVKKGTKANSDTLTVSGKFFIDGSFQAGVPLKINLGTQSFEIAAESLKLAAGVVTCTNAVTTPGTAGVKFDLNRGVYTITVKNTAISVSGRVDFSVEFPGPGKIGPVQVDLGS